ncbi:bifunctional diguanylate cyclase/phosphodiesterase [Massilia sp. PWRC2]|uniref:bifunctional diguanylate cyclase/phosphodiesterase n=1 Tax=Massilia sp. PWRC2 TaxID=2804626 RepID=UPI003CE72C19
MAIKAHFRLGVRLGKLYGLSIYGAMLLVVAGGLVLPAVVGSYLSIGVQEQKAARAALNEALVRNTDILALGMQESLWNMNAESARSLGEAVMRDPSVLTIRVTGQNDSAFVLVRSTREATGTVLTSSRDIIVRGERIGKVSVEMDDARSQQELHSKQSSYALMLASQIGISLLLIVLFLNQRLIRPLRSLMQFSDRLGRGEFDQPLAPLGEDELGRLGSQMEQMRVAIRNLFDDIGQREERFRTIVNQMPGAVFRYRPNGVIEFLSDTIEEISGYPAAQLIGGSTDQWSNIIAAQDRRMQRRAIAAALASSQAYAIEYRIIDATGVERWVAENGQPQSSEGDVWVDGIVADISERKHNEMRIEGLLAEQSAILDNVMFGVMFVRHRRVVSVNRRCEELFGYANDSMAGGSTALMFPSDEGFAGAGNSQYAVLAEGKYVSEERQYRRRDGAMFWCLVSGFAVDPLRPHEGSIWVFADITERKLAEETLRLSATVLEHIADGVMVTDTEGNIVAVNRGFTQITGYTEAEVIGLPSSLSRLGRYDKVFYHHLWEDLAATGYGCGDIWNVRKNGDAYLESLTVSAVLDTAGAVTHFVAVFSDITSVRQSQDKLDHMAHHDPLTALPNRLLFHDRLEHALQRSACEHQQLAILFIDLDRFKNVNDTLGHQVGDALLKLVAGALAAQLRDGDTLARLGGDEFVVLLENVDAMGAASVAAKLVAMFEQPFCVASYELFVTGSVGIGVYPGDAVDADLLIRNADVAMYQAKARGRNNYQFYAPSMSGEGVERLRLEALLRRAIEKNEIFLNYQPQVDMASGRLTGVEALVRWQNPELGLVPPTRFIAVAEDTGFINPLGKWVLEQACRQMVRWEQAGLVVPKMAVNLSVRQFERGSIVGMVADILRETGLAPQRLQLEVTESLIMNTADVLAFVNDLRALGVGLAIDDFGTGYSSLAYLQQLPVQTLKIDRSFIKDIANDSNDGAITIAIIQLAKSLNLSVIAEGVETEQQVAFLQRHGCRHAQGFYFARPGLPEELLKRWQVAA